MTLQNVIERVPSLYQRVLLMLRNLVAEVFDQRVSFISGIHVISKRIFLMRQRVLLVLVNLAEDDSGEAYVKCG